MSTRDDASCDDQEMSLGAYVLGKLSADERDEFETHLAGCAGCRREHDEFQEVMAGMALLSTLELEEALGEPAFSAPPVVAPPTVASPTVAPPTVAAPAVTAPVDAGPRSPVPPRRSLWPWRFLPTSRPIRMALAGALTVVIVAVGFIWSAGPGGSPGPSGTPYVAADNSSNDVSLSIRVYNANNGVTVRGTVDGLGAGERYRLIASTLDQTQHIVLEWTAASGVQSLDGQIDVRAEDLALFAVSHLDGTVVVSASCRPHPAD